MFFRSKRIIHRDFKISNFLIGPQMDLKVSDFGLAVQLESMDERRMSVCGTPTYMAPEVIKNNEMGYSFESDVWALGICMYHMLTGRTPF
jgi:serine/threonine protein kinase